MAAQGIDLAEEFQSFIAERIRSGRYATAAEAYEAAKSAMLRDEADDDLDVEYVRQAVEEGVASGTYKGDAFVDLRKKYGLPARV